MKADINNRYPEEPLVAGKQAYAGGGKGQRTSPTGEATWVQGIGDEMV